MSSNGRNVREGEVKLGSTLQGYITKACSMQCGHCRSWKSWDGSSDMSPETLSDILETLEMLNVDRFEFFSADPLECPNIEELVQIANESSRDYGVLTVGKSPNGDLCVEQRFSSLLDYMSDNRKGSLVFSVDFSEMTAREYCAKGRQDSRFPYAWKALAFWENVERVKKAGVPIRANIVISRDNIDEVSFIAEEIAQMGLAVSCCFVQTKHERFRQIQADRTISAFSSSFLQFLRDSCMLSDKEIAKIYSEAYEIARGGKTSDEEGIFNAFRGLDPWEAGIPEENLQQLRGELLALKDKFGDKIILPGRQFIQELGTGSNIGCPELLRQGIFPQLKVDSNGRLFFCCDLHDPITNGFALRDLRRKGKRVEFLKEMRLNPYIWMCLFFNGGCQFSVNYVKYSAANVSATKK